MRSFGALRKENPNLGFWQYIIRVSGYITIRMFVGMCSLSSLRGGVLFSVGILKIYNSIFMSLDIFSAVVEFEKDRSGDMAIVLL